MSWGHNHPFLGYLQNVTVKRPVFKGTAVISCCNSCLRSVDLEFLTWAAGYLAAALSECVGSEEKVIAVDPDGDKLKVAQEKYMRDNIVYVNGNDATFPAGPYDVVLSNQVMHWVRA